MNTDGNEHNNSNDNNTLRSNSEETNNNSNIYNNNNPIHSEEDNNNGNINKKKEDNNNNNHENNNNHNHSEEDNKNIQHQQGGANNHSHQNHNSHHNNEYALIQHHAGVAGSTKSQAGNTGNLKTTHHDDNQDNSTSVSSKMKKMDIAPSTKLQSKTRAKKSKVSSSSKSKSTTSTSSKKNRVWYCDGTCNSENGRAQPFANFQSYVQHHRSMHNLTSSNVIATAINHCRYNILGNNPQVFGCPDIDCNQVCVGYEGIKVHWSLTHPDKNLRMNFNDLKMKKSSNPSISSNQSSSNVDLDQINLNLETHSTLSDLTIPSFQTDYPTLLHPNTLRPFYNDNGLNNIPEDIFKEDIFENESEESSKNVQHKDKEKEEEKAQEIYGLSLTDLPHDDGTFDVSDAEHEDDDPPIITVDQIAEETVVQPSNRPKIDYFETISEDGTILPALQVGVLIGQAYTVIDEFLAMPEAEQLQYICGVPHLRTNDVDFKHKDSYREITKRLMRASLGSSLDSYITGIRHVEVVHDNVIPTAVEVDRHGMEINPRPPLSEETRAFTATVAFHLLPTVYRMLKTSKSSIHGNPRSFLDGMLAINNIDQLIGSIIFLFNKGKPKLGSNHTNNLAPPSDATIRRKTRKLVLDDGHVSRGMNYLCRHAEKDSDAPPPPQLSNDEFQSKVKTLHPERHPIHDNLDYVQDCPNDSNLDTLKLKATTLNTTLRRLKRDGAPGFDGWTFQLIRQLFEQDMASINDDEPSEDAILLIAFITHALAGRMPFQKLWNTSRMVLQSEWQPQKKTWKFRPLAIGTSWYRFIGKAALALIGDSVGRQLAPCQLAVGISDGISIGAQLLQHVREDPDNAILSLDISNAFNSIRRNRILEGLRKYAPSLIPFYKWSYSSPTQVRSSAGALCCDAETGTRQGDPLSMLFFSVGIHQRLLHLSERIQTLSSEHLLHTQAYADDMSICLPRQKLKQAWDIVADVFPIGLPGAITHDPDKLFDEIGIAINPNKCVAITGSPTLMVRNPLSSEAEVTSEDNNQMEEEILYTGQENVVIPIRRSAKIFGVMIGTREDRLTFVSDLHDQIQKKADYIRRFCGAKAGFLLIKYCLNTIATYVHRIEHPIGLDLVRHDKIISDALASYVEQAQLGPNQEIIRALPHSLGGLGILRHDSFQTQINHDELHIRTLSWLKHKGPSPVNVEGIQADNDAEQTTIIHPGLHQLYQTFPRLNNQPHYLANIGFHKGQRENISASTRKLNAHKENVEKLKKRLVSKYNTMGDALWLDGSGYNGSGDLYNIGTFYTRFFTDNTFAATLGARLLINDTLPQEASNNVRVYCPHCNMTDLPFPHTATKYHYLGCRALQRSRVRRHDHIVQHLYKFLSRVFKDTANIQCEQYSHQPDIDQRRDDITINVHSGEVSIKMGFDIGITTPVQSSLLERSIKSNQDVNSLLAATKMFDEKTHKYRNSLYDVYPIIFLATGRPSNHMKKMLAALEPHIAIGKAEFHAYWRRFLRDTMCTCTQFIAKAYLNRPALHTSFYRNGRVISQQRTLNQTRLRLQRKRKSTSSSTNVDTNLLRKSLSTRQNHNSHTHTNTPTYPDDVSFIKIAPDDTNSWTSGNPFNKPKNRNQFK